MLIGEFDHNIDKKGRMILPARFREEMGDSVVVNRGLDGCLYVYTIEQWEKSISAALCSADNAERCPHVCAHDAEQSNEM